MAARLNPKTSDEVRAKIQAVQLVNVVQNHALGKKILKDQSRIAAAKILLAKVIPDVKAIEHSGEVVQQVRAVIVPAKQLESDGNAVASITQAG